MKGLLSVIVAGGITVVMGLEARADFHAPEDKANYQLNRPATQKISRRLQQSMDRMARNGIEDARLREMLARSSLDKNVDGELIRADRQKEPRAKIDGYEQALAKVHPNNLKYRLKILNSIVRQAIPARISRAEHIDLQTRIATTRYAICEIERDGYSQSQPPEKFAKRVQEAEKCLVSMCDVMKQYYKPCPDGGPRIQTGRVLPDPPRPDPPKSRPRPSSPDPNAGRLRETEMFYIAGLPKDQPVPLRSDPSGAAPIIDNLAAGDRIASRTPPGSRDRVRGYVRVCPTAGKCGWVEEKHVTHGTEYAAARRAVDYYLIALRSSSVRGMLDLVTGPARQTFEKLARRHPGKKVKDIATQQPMRWNARCAACDGDICQLLYDVEEELKRRRDLVIFEARRGADARFRMAATRNYTGNNKSWFDTMHPHCWQR